MLRHDQTFSMRPFAILNPLPSQVEDLRIGGAGTDWSRLRMMWTAFVDLFQDKACHGKFRVFKLEIQPVKSRPLGKPLRMKALQGGRCKSSNLVVLGRMFYTKGVEFIAYYAADVAFCIVRRGSNVFFRFVVPKAEGQAGGRVSPALVAIKEVLTYFANHIQKGGEPAATAQSSRSRVKVTLEIRLCQLGHLASAFAGDFLPGWRSIWIGPSRARFIGRGHTSRLGRLPTRPYD